MSVTMSSRLSAIAAQAVPRASAVVQKTVADIEAQAKGVAPVDTGRLRSDIAGKMTGQLSGEVVSSVHYSIYLEYGTRKMSAQPYMSPAAEKVRPAFEAAMRSVIL